MNAVQSRPAPFRDEIISQPSPKTDQEPHSPGAPYEPPVIGGLRHREGAFVPALLTVLAGLVVVAGMAVVITAGFALSFDAIRVVGRAARIRPDWAWLLPAAIDGAMAVATITVVVLRRIHQPTAYPWAVVLINAAISVACNGLHAFTGNSVSLPPVIAMAVSAVPAVNLALPVHLLVALIDALAEVLKRSTRTATSGESHARRPPHSIEGGTSRRHPLPEAGRIAMNTWTKVTGTGA